MTKIEVKNGHGATVFLAVLALISCAFGIWQYGKGKAVSEERKQVMGSLVAYQDSLEYARVKLSDTVAVMAAKTAAVYMDKRTMERLYRAEAENARKLGARLKDIQSMQQVTTVTRDTVYTPVYIDNAERMCTSFGDGYVTIHACIPKDGDATVDYSITDSLQIVEYYVPHSILWGLVKWSSRTGEYAAIPMNPKSHIEGFKVEKVIR